jgi:EAL domain-containing protein (putative c-di-GMP-specific phosphodiesterase class I)
VVKIDQSFIRKVTSDERTRLLVTTMIDMSHSLDYRVVAEGVETLDVLEVLRELGCDEVQGYYFAKPMQPKAFMEWYGQLAAAATLPHRHSLLDHAMP